MKNISFKLIFRSWWRNKTFTIISILSLAVGIACVNLLAAFVIHEYNVEGDNPNRGHIVAVKRTYTNSGVENYTIPPTVVDQLSSHVPELDEACVVKYCFTVSHGKVGEHFFTDFNVLDVDTAFYRFFPQKVVRGSLEDALVGPDRVVLTESFARRLFGHSDPIGQMVQIFFRSFPREKRDGLLSFTVSAVIKDDYQAANRFDALLMAEPAQATTYFKLKENVSIAELQAKTEDLVLKSPSGQGTPMKYTFQSVQETCFDPALTTETKGLSTLLKTPNRNLLWIALFSAVLILMIACFNYINLSFSRVFKQLHSLHIQKLMGANPQLLSGQLFLDTFMTVGLGFLIAQLIQFDLLGVMSRIMSVQVPASFLYSSQVLPVTFGFILLLACIPALYMSRRLPEMSISSYNNFYRGKARQRIITTLAVVQFAISFVLIIGSFTLRQQLSLLQGNTENYRDLYSFSIGGEGRLTTLMGSLKERIALIPGVQAATTTIGSHPLQARMEDASYIDYCTMDNGDEDMMEVMNHKLLKGLPWKEAIARFPNPAYLNRTWADILFPDGEIPIGHSIKEIDPKFGEYLYSKEVDHLIAGVVEDYYWTHVVNSLEKPIGKGIITYTKDSYNLTVRIDPNHLSTALQQIYAEWDKLHPGDYLEHENLRERVLNNNKKLFELSDLLMMYSIISLLLTCFGLFGMSLYAIEQRTKEIGIRKVNGSTTWQIMTLLNRQFIGWISVAFGVAIPVVWLLLDRWMQNFVYRADFSIWVYILSLLLVTAITLLTVSWHSYRAASGNPVKALRDE
ncbi:ABC transporter permease [Parabacteroides sp. PF5-6]|uniref:ABC transporter permease n=1 Tax=Parabacteroides sp. PF5-6 TaxID=1742403 RepID=UPI0024071567|nr:ABC transporter permease [Parabacteroides sp. PF5-6]MDF9829151.1 putative ABC transport system permease protein [Parabacteroides sp. PF5-6]